MKFNIGNKEWEIIEEDNGDNVYIEKEDNLVGITLFIPQKIYIYKHLNPQRKRETLIHELTHAFIEEVGLSSVLDDGNMTNELMCDFVGKYADSIIDITNRYFEEVY